MSRFSAALGGLRTMAHRGHDGLSRHAKRQISRLPHVRDLRLESLEDRTLLSIGCTSINGLSSPSSDVPQPNAAEIATLGPATQKTLPVTPTTPPMSPIAVPVAPIVKSNPVTHLAVDSSIVVQQGSNAGASAGLASFPASFDLRSDNGHNYVTSVKNQGHMERAGRLATTLRWRAPF